MCLGGGLGGIERDRERQREKRGREGLRLGFNTLGIATCKWKS